MNVEEILKKLVAFPVLGGESNLEILAWIQSYISSFGITSYLVPNEDHSKASLHCRIGPVVDGGVILSGHMDVVPVEGQEWTTDPFILTDKGDGKLYGRGSCDMKGFLACCLAVLPKMAQTQLHTPIYFAFSYDEEIGCLSAPALVEHIKATYKEQPKYAIIGEPSMMEPIVGQKGIYVSKTTVNGSAGHSSRIKQEVSALHEAVKLVQWLENKMNALIEEKRFDDRFNPPHSTLHVGKFKSGIAPNVIADKAEFYWDVRVIPDDNLEQIIAEFTAFCKEREEEMRKVFPDFSITTIEDHPPVPCLDTKETDDVIALITDLCGNKELKTVSYAAEAGQFANGGFQAVICGPGSIIQAHRANEFISKDQLQKGVTMIGALVSKLSS